MSWKSVNVNNCRMWKRSDGVIANGYQIEAIERAEKEEFDNAINRSRNYETPRDIENEENEQTPQMSGREFVATGVLIIIALVMIFS